MPFHSERSQSSSITAAPFAHQGWPSAMTKKATTATEIQRLRRLQYRVIFIVFVGAQGSPEPSGQIGVLVVFVRAVAVLPSVSLT